MGLVQGLGEAQALRVDTGLGMGLGLGLEGRLISSWKSSGKCFCCCSEVSGPLLRVKTQPSCDWRSTRRPGGSSRVFSTSGQEGNVWRSWAQQRYCREVGVQQARITFILLLAAVEQTMG